MADWLRENFRTDEGKAFDEFTVPWVTAPNGPCAAVDNVKYQTVWLQWAARMFKTQFGQSVQMMTADRAPCRMLFASTDETMVKRVFGRLWEMCEHCPPLRDHVPPERLRNKTHITLLSKCDIHSGWPRGKSRLADLSIRVGHANEIDKWVVESTTTEGHPLARFRKRGDQYPDRKFILESTPGQKHKSAVEDGRLQSTNCRYEVPCPHCGKFQKLIMGDGEHPGGIFWEKDTGGRSTPEIAAKTAYYVCKHCQQHIYDIHRPDMMNSGVWVHEGCTVDHEAALRAREFPPDDRSWMLGEPMRDGTDYGSQISAIYALFWGWGQIAARFLQSKRRTQNLRQFINEDLGETWEVSERKDGPEQICQRMVVPRERGQVPQEYPLLTIGIDKQKDHYVYVVKAWGAESRSHTVDYGECWGKGDGSGGLAELRAVLQREWPVQGGRPAIRIRQGLIDSGHYPKDVARFVADCKRSGVNLLACKGSSAQLNAMFRKSVQGRDSAMPGQVLVLVDTSETQNWMEDVLYRLSPSDPWGMSIFAGSYFDHENYIAQLLNDAPMDALDARGNIKVTWDRVNPHDPNDYRDCERYALAASMVIRPERLAPSARPSAADLLARAKA